MGDLEVWMSGFSIDEDALFAASSSRAAAATTQNGFISTQSWRRAEKTAQEIISRIQPTEVSEERRLFVIDYIQRLIKTCTGAEVFPFGSVPLKTYLPDGDIDLTALCLSSNESALADHVRIVLEAEEHNNVATFEVKDVQIIHAEVKLIKCLVQDIVVDISFNQSGGLCTLCFLEQVDRLIDKNHLFKRSILLIKAWCYYESRILGAHHGLISTYGLETLVLYIFHLFNPSLNGPLAVLYRFLDYYSKFDWDNYCVSLNGPVNVSCLPEIVAEAPDNDEGELLLDKEFLKSCVESFSVKSKGHDTGPRSFLQKHFNIVDPLRENNNLGRSISKGNFYRIRSAFTYGARKLGQILSSPRDSIADELKKFFTNTLDRHGNGRRPDVHSSSNIDVGQWTEGMEESRFGPHGFLHERIGGAKVSRSDRMPGTGENEQQRDATGSGPSSAIFEKHGSANGNPRLHATDDEKDHATFRTQGPRTMSETSKLISPQGESGKSPLRKPYRPPQLSLSHSFPENRRTGNGLPDHSRWPPLDDSYPHFRDVNSAAGGSGTLNFVADLTGDYDSQLYSLECAQRCHDQPFSGSFLPTPQSPSNVLNNDTFRQSMQLNMSVFPHMNANGAVTVPQFYPANPRTISAGTFGVEDIPKPRGTGTYFPNMNLRSYKDKLFQGRGRNAQIVGPGHLQRPPPENGWAAPPETSSLGRGGQDPFRERLMVLPTEWSAGPPDSVQGASSSNGFAHASDFSLSPEELEFGNFGHLSLPSPSSEASRQHTLGTHTESLLVTLPTPATGRAKTTGGVSLQTYHLKNEADFPPLSF